MTSQARRQSLGNAGKGNGRPTVVRKTIALLALTVFVLASCSSGPTPPARQPGILSGLVIGHTSQGSDRAALTGAVVSLFRQEVSSGGPVRQNPPKPVVTVRTDGAGVFRFRGLPAGRWFVLAVGQAGPGRWVRFDPVAGAVVTLVVCTDCPIPA